MLDKKQEKTKQPVFSKKKQFITPAVVALLVFLALVVLPSQKPMPKKEASQKNVR